MNILFLISYYKIGDGTSAALYSQIKGDAKLTNYLVLCKWKITAQEDLNIRELKESSELLGYYEKYRFDLIHYFKATFSDLFNLTVDGLGKKMRLPVLTTVCQRPSFKNHLLSPYELRHSSHFVFIDKTSYNDPLLDFIPVVRKSQIYLSSEDHLKEKTASVPFKKNEEGVIVYGRGSTLSKCPQNMFEVFDAIQVPGKRFCIVGIPQGNNWVREKAAGRKDVLLYDLLPYEEWFEVCKTFDVCLYQIPKDSHASLDANLGLPMLMGKPVVYYGAEAPKERFIHGVNGFVAQTCDEMAQYATQLGLDEGLRKSVGEAARQKNIEMFSYAKRMDAYHRLYSSIGGEPVLHVPLRYKMIYLLTCYRCVIRSILNWYPSRRS